MHNGAIVNARLKPDLDYRPPSSGCLLILKTTRHGELYRIGLEGCGQRIVYMLGPENGNASALDFELEYVAMFARSYWKNLMLCLPLIYPDVIIGWNVVQFDLRNAAKTCRALSYSAAAGAR